MVRHESTPAFIRQNGTKRLLLCAPAPVLFNVFIRSLMKCRRCRLLTCIAWKCAPRLTSSAIAVYDCCPGRRGLRSKKTGRAFCPCAGAGCYMLSYIGGSLRWFLLFTDDRHMRTIFFECVGFLEGQYICFVFFAGIYCRVLDKSNIMYYNTTIMETQTSYTKYHREFYFRHKSRLNKKAALYARIRRKKNKKQP